MELTERQKKVLTLLGHGRPLKVAYWAAGYNSEYHLNADLRKMRRENQFDTTYQLIYHATKNGLI